MRKSCAKAVRERGTSPVVAHILYSFFPMPFPIRTARPQQQPQRPQLPSPSFPTAILPMFNLLTSRLSPFYTSPITNTTTYTNK